MVAGTWPPALPQGFEMMPDQNVQFEYFDYYVGFIEACW